jgi:hypothetical protein
MSEPHIAPNEAQQIVSEATVFMKEEQKRRASIRPSTPGITRQRAALAAHIVTVPMLIGTIAINMSDRSMASLLEPAPSPQAVARQARTTLDALVAEVEAFRDDYHELPESLSEIGLPQEGHWSYAVDDGLYRITGSLYGQTVTYQSTVRVRRAARPAVDGEPER